MLTNHELKTLIYLVGREAQEMREGWQLAGIGEVERLEALAIKLKQIKAPQDD